MASVRRVPTAEPRHPRGDKPNFPSRPPPRRPPSRFGRRPARAATTAPRPYGSRRPCRPGRSCRAGHEDNPAGEHPRRRPQPASAQPRPRPAGSPEGGGQRGTTAGTVAAMPAVTPTTPGPNRDDVRCERRDLGSTTQERERTGKPGTTAHRAIARATGRRTGPAPAPRRTTDDRGGRRGSQVPGTARRGRGRGEGGDVRERAAAGPRWQQRHRDPRGRRPAAGRRHPGRCWTTTRSCAPAVYLAGPNDVYVFALAGPPLRPAPGRRDHRRGAAAARRRAAAAEVQPAGAGGQDQRAGPRPGQGPAGVSRS